MLLRAWPPLAQTMLVAAIAWGAWHLSLQQAPLPLHPPVAPVLPEADPAVPLLDPLEPGEYRAALVEIASRPLMLEGRRPPELTPVLAPEPETTPKVAPIARPAPRAAPTAQPLPRLRMMAYVDDGQRQEALVEVDGDGAARWVRAGQDVSGWTIAEILPRQMRLLADGREEIVKMFE